MKIVRQLRQLGRVDREVWSVLVGSRGEDSDLEVTVTRYERQVAGDAEGEWITVAWWSTCHGPACRAPVNPLGAVEPLRLGSMPCLDDDEILRQVRERMIVVWPEGSLTSGTLLKPAAITGTASATPAVGGLTEATLPRTMVRGRRTSGAKRRSRPPTA